MALLVVIGLAGGCVSMEPVHPDKSLHFLHGYARALAYSPDGRTLVALKGRDENSAVVLDGVTLSPIRTLSGSDGARKVLRSPPGAVAFSADGELLATAGLDDVVVLWRTDSWKEIRRIPDTQWVTGVGFLPDGKTLATAGPGPNARLWNVETGAMEAELKGHQMTMISVAVSKDGSLLASGSTDRTARVWDLQSRTQQAIFDQKVAPVSSIAFAPDGSKVATSASGLGAMVWNTRENPPGRPASLRSTPRGADATEALVFVVGLASVVQALTTGGAGTLASPVTPTRVSEDMYCPVAVSPDGKLLAVIQHSPNIRGDYQVEIYNLIDQSRIAEYFAGTSALAFSPDSKTLAVSGFYRVILLDPSTGKELPRPARRK
jgi:WD40 repeat protein